MNSKSIGVYSLVIIISLVGIFLSSGCTSLSEKFYRTGLDRRVFENINLKNGINYREAVILAQRTLLNSKYTKVYLVSKPIVGFDAKYNLWAVSFECKKSGYDSCGYGVMINKDTGEIKDGCMSGL
jgi:hypothetical protein